MTQKNVDELKLAVYSAVSRDDSLSRAIEGDDSFSALLGKYVQLECSEDEAARHWDNIIGRMRDLTEALSRPVSLHTAIADYCTHPPAIIKTPYLVEGAVFRDALQLAMIDPLTGAFNRRYMDIVLRKEFNRCERWGKSFSLCMIDIDDFKKINDTKGHPFGDQVLQRISALLGKTVRDEDVLCRYGGEEFLVILPETDEEGAQVLSSRLRSALKQDLFFTRNAITFSGGIATYPGLKTVEELVSAADRALYQAKYNGKDQIVAATPERRQFGRFPYPWTLSVIDRNTNEELADITALNVSLGGVQFSCDIPYNVDMPLHLVFRNPETGTAELDTGSLISWVKKTRSSYLYGVRFEESPSPLRERLLSLPAR